MMGQIWDKALKVFAAAIGAVAGALGGWSWLMTVLLACMIADYISGTLVAWMGKSLKTEYGGLSSKVGAVGLIRKGLMLMVVLVAALLDRALGQNNAMFRDAVCWFYVANEGISLMENLNLAGVPFPKKLKELLGEKAGEAESAE
ncbi:MAG TPA: phage holin family protein [Candidatus Limiplasma sp.]|nr:phage holin family protein [Candidatus Limiplasma sp.]